MNIDVEIVLFVLGFIIGCALTFTIALIATKDAVKTTTKYVVVKEQKPVKNDDWKTYEKVYESEEK